MGYVQEGRRVAGQYRDEQMTTIKKISRIFKDEGWRVFMLAVFASLAWHIFWLSTIAIVSKPANDRSVRFSKVSFLGPLLGKGGMELQARPKERSFLEARYLAGAGRLSLTAGQAINTAAGRYEGSDGASRIRDDQMTTLIDDALGAEKLEPSRDEE